ncbi:hypothetical protein AB1N83_014345 [Pleurotus pulmonarius]
MMRWTVGGRGAYDGRQEVDERHADAEISKVMRLGFGVCTPHLFPVYLAMPSHAYRPVDAFDVLHAPRAPEPQSLTHRPHPHHQRQRQR